MPKVFDIELKDVNSIIVSEIETHAQNNIEHTLDSVFTFLNKRKDFEPQYKVFKEYFVLCWAGQKKIVKEETFFSRVDIEMINEQVRLFYSTLDEVSIVYNEDSFKIIEYVNLGLHDKNKYIQLEETIIKFHNNANYTLTSNLLFQPPQYDKKELYHIYNSNNAILEKLNKGYALHKNEILDLKNLPITYLICYFNNIPDALDKFFVAKTPLKDYSEDVFNLYKEANRILRKVKYS
jgi:hypothetical protein